MPKLLTIALVLTIIILLTSTGCQDWGVEYDARATHQASGPAEEAAYATATTTAEAEREASDAN